MEFYRLFIGYLFKREWTRLPKLSSFKAKDIALHTRWTEAPTSWMCPLISGKRLINLMYVDMSKPLVDEEHNGNLL